MRRWNGWGDEANHYPMPDGGERFLEERIGRGRVLNGTPLNRLSPRFQSRDLSTTRLSIVV